MLHKLCLPSEVSLSQWDFKGRITTVGLPRLDYHGGITTVGLPWYLKCDNWAFKYVANLVFEYVLIVFCHMGHKCIPKMWANYVK